MVNPDHPNQRGDDTTHDENPLRQSSGKPTPKFEIPAICAWCPTGMKAGAARAPSQAGDGPAPVATLTQSSSARCSLRTSMRPVGLHTATNISSATDRVGVDCDRSIPGSVRRESLSRCSRQRPGERPRAAHPRLLPKERALRRRFGVSSSQRTPPAAASTGTRIRSVDSRTRNCLAGLLRA